VTAIIIVITTTGQRSPGEGSDLAIAGSAGVAEGASDGLTTGGGVMDDAGLALTGSGFLSGGGLAVRSVYALP
jgi:hypothetical protein